MADQARSTLPRPAKGPIAPPPALTGKLKAVADAIAAWPDVEATVHWRFDEPGRVDGVATSARMNSAIGHLDGSIHLATPPRLRSDLVAEGLGKPFVWGRGWTTASIHRLAWTDPWRCSGATTIGFGLRANRPEHGHGRRVDTLIDGVHSSLSLDEHALLTRLSSVQVGALSASI
jgi:hypothetical protein